MDCEKKQIEKIATDLESMKKQIETLNIRLTVMETQLNMLSKAVIIIPVLISVFTFIMNYLDAVMHF